MEEKNQEGGKFLGFPEKVPSSAGKELDTKEKEKEAMPEAQEKRREQIETKREEIEKSRPAKEEEEKARQILAEAKAEGKMGLPSREVIVERLVEACFREGVEAVLRALQAEGDPHLFDEFRDRITEPQTWQRLVEEGKL